jgi:hypothetical protein
MSNPRPSGETADREAATLQIGLSSGSLLDTIQEDYEIGELTVAYDRSATGRRLLFGVVELLPMGTEPGPRDPAPRHERLGGKAEHELNVVRWHLAPAEAVAWYSDARAGTARLPPLNSESEGLPLKFGILDAEPPWPSTALEYELFWDRSPLWGQRPGGARISQLLCVADHPDITHWTNAQRERARTWLASNLPFDILARPILLGSINLILPNPLFRHVSQRQVNDDGTRVALEVRPYTGDSLKGLTVIVREHRPAGPAVVSVQPLPGPRVVLQFPHAVHQTSIEIVCPRRGLLYKSEPAVFIHEIRMGLDLIAGVREVTVPARSTRRPSEVLSTQIVSPDRTISVGKARPQGARQLAVLDRMERKQSRLSRKIVHWFNGDVDEATRFVRKLISAGRKTVLIVDPYFDKTELARFTLANATRGVTC